jgi:hypothetical protein
MNRSLSEFGSFLRCPTGQGHGPGTIHSLVESLIEKSISTDMSASVSDVLQFKWT